jgi:hypothetical protein
MRFIPFLVVVAALSMAGVALGTNPPGQIAAQQNCKLLGYVIGTDAFAQCLQGNTSKGKTTPSTGSKSQPTVSLARQICVNKGLTKGTAAFTRCLNRQLKLAAKTP